MTTWHLPAGHERTWQVLADPAMTWPLWWPGMTALSVDPAHDGLVGSRTRLELRATRWSYALRFGLEVVAADPPTEAVLRVTGDLHGTGRVRVTGAGRGSIVRLDWDVTTERGWMNATAPLLGRSFVAAHDRAMSAGERGLARYLAD